MNFCPCRSDKTYHQCCKPLHLHASIAKNPEALMRSRYSAYVMGEIEYIYKTYAPSSRAEQSIQSIKDWANSVSFINLEIVEASKGTDDDSYGFVEFVASYIDSDQLCKLHERSRFMLNNHQWFYIDGQIIPHPTKSIGRNESCPCGSGKKFKRCHS